MKKVYVEWVDAVTEDAWTEIETLKDYKCHEVTTVAILLSEDEERLLVAHSVSRGSSCGALVIPRKLIKKLEITEL